MQKAEKNADTFWKIALYRWTLAFINLFLLGFHLFFLKSVIFCSKIRIFIIPCLSIFHTITCQKAKYGSFFASSSHWTWSASRQCEKVIYGNLHLTIIVANNFLRKKTYFCSNGLKTLAKKAKLSKVLLKKLSGKFNWKLPYEKKIAFVNSYSSHISDNG